MPEGYCVKERKKVEIKDPEQITMKNGRPAITGTCPDWCASIQRLVASATIAVPSSATIRTPARPAVETWSMSLTVNAGPPTLNT